MDIWPRGTDLDYITPPPRNHIELLLVKFLSSAAAHTTSAPQEVDEILRRGISSPPRGGGLLSPRGHRRDGSATESETGAEWPTPTKTRKSRSSTPVPDLENNSLQSCGNASVLSSSSMWHESNNSSMAGGQGVSSSGTVVTISAAPIDVAIRNNAPLPVIAALLRYPNINFSYCGPMRVAAECDRIDCIKLLLDDPRIDINTGTPVRIAAESARYEFLKALLQLGGSRVNPNRGWPIVHALKHGNIECAKLIIEAPNAIVNRTAPIVGLTPLCYASYAGQIDIVSLLLSHPRLDVNRGIFFNPIQLAVMGRHPAVVQRLLKSQDLQVNRAVLHTKPAIQLAFDSYVSMGNHCAASEEIVDMLLDDPRTEISDELLTELEEGGRLAALEKVNAASTEAVMGSLWHKRITLIFIATLMVLFTAVFEFTLLVADDVRKTPTTKIVTASTNGSVILIINIMSSLIATAALWTSADHLLTRGGISELRRVSSSRSFALLRLVPGFPLYDLVVVVFIARNIVYHGTMVEREARYSALQLSMVLQSVSAAFPLMIAHMVYAATDARFHVAGGHKLCAFLAFLCFAKLPLLYLVRSRVQPQRPKTAPGTAHRRTLNAVEEAVPLSTFAV